MHNLIPSNVSYFFYGSVAFLIFLYLADHPVICFDEIEDAGDSNTKGSRISCDKQYRSEFLKDNVPMNDPYVSDINSKPKVVTKAIYNQGKKEIIGQPEDLFPPIDSEFIKEWPTINSSQSIYDREMLSQKHNSDVLKTQQLEETKNHRYKRSKPDVKFFWPYPELGGSDGSLSFTGMIHFGSASGQNICKENGIVDVTSGQLLPYMAFINTGCGGAIISEKFVITAGHCVDGEKPKCVYVGSSKLMAGCRYSISRVYKHPKYSRDKLANDIALIKVAPSFEWSRAIRPIRMSPAKVVENTCGTVAGWGAGVFTGRMKMNLAMQTIPILPSVMCWKYGITESQFCAGFPFGSINSCRGDSGVPFVQTKYVVGITSYGFRSTRAHNPGVYEDVYYHRKWIRGITGTLKSKT